MDLATNRSQDQSKKKNSAATEIPFYICRGYGCFLSAYISWVFASLSYYEILFYQHLNE